MPSYSLLVLAIQCLAIAPKRAYAEQAATASACPSREAIATAVESALGNPLSADDLNQVEVEDLGDSYTVRIRDRVREYLDHSRDCPKRARIAAVFVALTLAPPDIRSEQSPAPSEQSNGEPANQPVNVVAQEPARADTALAKQEHVTWRSAPNAWRPSAELAVRGNVAPRSDKSVFDVGGQAQFVYASSRWGITLGAYVPTSSRLELDRVRVREARYAGFAGVRMPWHVLGLRANADVCAALSLLRLRQDTPNSNTATRFEPALHLGNTWALDKHWVSPFVGVYAELVPLSASIAVEPTGVIGHSPALWFGVAMGVTLGND